MYLNIFRSHTKLKSNKIAPQITLRLQKTPQNLPSKNFHFNTKNCKKLLLLLTFMEGIDIFIYISSNHCRTIAIEKKVEGKVEQIGDRAIDYQFKLKSLSQKNPPPSTMIAYGKHRTARRI